MEQHASRPRRGHGKADHQPVTPDTLMRMTEQTSARSFTIRNPALAHDDTAILGRLNNLHCLSGLYVHATDTLEAHDLAAEWEMPAACTVALILEGSLDVLLDRTTLRLGLGDLPAGHLWSLAKPAHLVRRSRKGTRVRKVVITLPWVWIHRILADRDLPNRNLARFVATHRAHRQWTPSPHALALAEQILNPARAPAPLQNMSAESRAIEIVREALESVIAEDSTDSDWQPATKMQAKARTIRTYVLSHLDDNPALPVMARSLGMSVGSMQNAFKAVYGRTIGDFCRERRLQRARDEIADGGITVAEAAYRAGYSSPANFSTAFKRLFGISPSGTRT